ncbi:MAG TPA: TniB family NTP-binding protein [Blastocatellia bacterium]|nr:TniB family NTP-binding protein [Blastocatellia bacterium]
MAEERITLAGKSDIERKEMIERIYINFPRLNHIKQQIEHCHFHSRIAAEPECLLITGYQGAGKTTTCRSYANRFRRESGRSGVRVPVIATAIPVPATTKSLVTKLLMALGDPAADRGTVVNQTLRLKHLLKACGVELIILDEFQHFIDRDSNLVLNTVSNWLKDLLNETNIPVVLAGMPYSDVILQANAQLERRFSLRLHLDPFGWETIEQQIEFRTFLAQVDQFLPLPKRSELQAEEMAYPLYFATNGIIGYVMKLLRTAARFAIERSLSCIDLSLLAEVYQERLASSAKDRPNPFRMGLDNLKEYSVASIQPSKGNTFNKVRITPRKSIMGNSLM